MNLTDSLYGSLFTMDTKEALEQLRTLDNPLHLRNVLCGYISVRKELIWLIASENKEEIVQRMAKYYLTKEQ